MIRNILIIIALVVGIGVLVLPRTFATENKKEDNVFLEEGDFDFADPTDGGAKAGAAKEAPVDKKAKKAAETQAPPPPPPTEEVPGIPATAELPEPSKPEPQVLAQPEVDNAPVPAELPKAKKSKMAAKANVAAKAPKSKKHSAGYFSVVKTECVMHREPAGDSPELIKVKPARKLWVEDENQEWVRGFRKSGDVGYFEKSCFE